MPANKTKNKRLYLIDGYAMLYRSHFALIRNPLINSKGMHTSALFGFINQMMKLINKDKPDLMVAAFDSSKKTFRHEKYPEYKATREKMPEEMVAQLTFIFIHKHSFCRQLLLDLSSPFLNHIQILGVIPHHKKVKHHLY